MGFVFPNDPTELLAEIAGGKKINLQKEFQFFATPNALCDKLVSMADINEKHLILEPSAGDGAIIKAINRVFPMKMVDCYELMGVNRTALQKLLTANLIGDDFIESKVERKYDRIVANPPFTKNADIDHLLKMYECLKPGGRVVCVTSTHWKFSSNKKETDFRTWLQNVDAKTEDVDAGTFKGSGTMIATMIITIVK
jgi:methylase of polypeptide subunit release factors